MQKRLFVAVNLPEDVKKRLFRFVEKEYGDLPVKWTRRENFHLTLNFLGFIPEESIPEICESVREAAESVQSFEVGFQKIEFGPSKEKRKMIWASGEKCEGLMEIKHRLDKALGFHTREKREFRPHINLGRIEKKKWEKMFPGIEIEKNFVFSVPVSSVELLESKLEKGKRAYYILESFSLE